MLPSIGISGATAPGLVLYIKQNKTKKGKNHYLETESWGNEGSHLTALTVNEPCPAPGKVFDLQRRTEKTAQPHPHPQA